MPRGQFHIVAQKHPTGCIPACAISVLKWYGRAHPTEEELRKKMGKQPSFTKLISALKAYAEVRVIRANEGEFCNRLSSLLAGERAVLVAIQPDMSKNAHCVVVTGYDGKHFAAHDPLLCSQPLEKSWLESSSCGDMAVIRPHQTGERSS